MKLFPWILILFLFLQLPYAGVQAQSRKVRQAERHNEKIEKKEQQDYEKRRKETLKHRYAIQSREVQERMKETEKRSKKYGRTRKEPFYKEIFHRKKKKRRNR